MIEASAYPCAKYSSGSGSPLSPILNAPPNPDDERQVAILRRQVEVELLAARARRHVGLADRCDCCSFRWRRRCGVRKASYELGLSFHSQGQVLHVVDSGNRTSTQEQNTMDMPEYPDYAEQNREAWNEVAPIHRQHWKIDLRQAVQSDLLRFSAISNGKSSPNFCPGQDRRPVVLQQRTRSLSPC